MTNNQFQSRSTKAILKIVEESFYSPKKTFFEIDSNKSIIYNLALFAIRSSGDYGELMDDGNDVSEILNNNSVPFREIQTPEDLYQNSRQILITFLDKDNSPVVINRKFGTTYMFNPKKYPYENKLSKNYKFKPFAFEIYARWPDKIKSPLDIVKFALRKNWTPIFLIFFSAFILGILNLFTPVLTSFLVNTIIPFSDQRLIIESIFFVLFVAVVTVITRFFNSLAILRMENVLNLKVETSLWTHLLRQPLLFFGDFGAADLVDRIGGISQIRVEISKGLITSLLALIFASSNFLLMIYKDWRLSIAAILLSIFYLIIILIIIWKKSYYVIPYQKASADLSDLGLQAINGMPQIRVGGNEPLIFSRWYEQALKKVRIKKNKEAYSNILEILSKSIQPLSQVIIFTIMLFLIKNNNTNYDEPNKAVASLIGFQAAYQAFNFQFTLAITQLSDSISEILGYWKRVEPIMYASPEETSNTKKINSIISGNFEFKDLTLRFPKTENPIFKNINFSIKAGSYTALTGPSGSGKSCLAKCILRLLNYETGSIYVDGIDITKFSLKNYRKQFGVVMQNTVLPTGSIYEIVKAGRVFSREEVWEALELSQIKEEIKSMPMGLETIINESASSISGGQRQRIALARALISKPKVLILDEATSALDASTQNSVMNVLNNLSITRIAIAHRLSTIENADQVIVLNNSKIEEIGKYKDLVLNPNGFFYKG
tara:strand:+ start:2353 stop:4506 length:2154 start_codon:yes stop_codon:yes gene_type:complete